MAKKSKKDKKQEKRMFGPFKIQVKLHEHDIIRLKKIFKEEKDEKDEQERHNNCDVEIPLSQVFPFVSDYIYFRRDPKIEKEIDGWKFTVSPEDEIIGSDFGFGSIAKISSERLTTFKKNTSCVCCGIEGSYFKKTQVVGKDRNSYHLNMYAVDGDKEILMTKDHVIPKSKGGTDSLDNYVTACVVCNNIKNSSLLSWDELRVKFLNEEMKPQFSLTEEDIKLMKLRIEKLVNMKVSLTA